jgi:predicted  nucleic acid-binding Zn-ribbon protein
MLEVIENLLILQDRDRKIMRSRRELADVGPQRLMLQNKLASSQAGLEAGKLRVKQIESDRKKLELEVDAKKQLIEKYSMQQFQTKKNEEYRALAHEIDTCKEAIVKIEDQELDLMEQAERAQKEVIAETQTGVVLKRDIEDQVAKLTVREENLAKELAELEQDRDKLAAGVEEVTLRRYERLLQHKGENVVVGIAHGVCGGCHMKLPMQLVVSCQGKDQLITCLNCGRILYYTPDMDLAVAD